jgi:hypothetical protein
MTAARPTQQACDRAEPANLRAQTLVTETSTRRAEPATLFPIKTIDKTARQSSAKSRERVSMAANGSLLITDVEVQAVACTDGVEQFLELAGRGRLGPGGPPALQCEGRFV